MKGHNDMNKNEFLEKLARKIKILNQNEVVDIIDEYAGYIDNKVAEGKSEEEAVADFGNVNDLAKEILSAYKLSEEYIPPDDFSGSKFFADTADILNKSVEFMTRFFKDINNHTNVNYVVSIIVTLFVALVLVAIIKIPFLVIEHLGRGFVHFVFPFFLHGILSFIWILLVNIVFFIVVILVFASLLKGGFSGNIDFIKNSIKNTAGRKNEYKKKYGKDWHKYYRGNGRSDSTETPASEAPDSDDHAPQRSDEENTPRKNAAKNPFIFLLRGFIHIFAAILLLPLFPSVIGLGIAAGVFVYLLTQGISVYGLTLLIIGFFILFTSFISLIIDIIYRHGKKLKRHVANALFASLLIGFGSVFSFFELMNYDYVDTIPETRKYISQNNYIYDIAADTIIINANGAILKYIIDNKLENKIVLDIRYNDLYNEIDIHSTVENQSSNSFFNNNNDSIQIITIDHSPKMIRSGVFYGKEIIKGMIDGLKDKKIYNINNLFIPEITVYANESFLRNVSGLYGNIYGINPLILERR